MSGNLEKRLERVEEQAGVQRYGHLELPSWWWDALCGAHEPTTDDVAELHRFIDCYEADHSCITARAHEGIEAGLRQWPVGSFDESVNPVGPIVLRECRRLGVPPPTLPRSCMTLIDLVCDLAGLRTPATHEERSAVIDRVIDLYRTTDPNHGDDDEHG